MSESLTYLESSVLVTGGAGFIGSDFVRTSVQKKQFKKIFVLDSFTYAADKRRLDPILNDIEVIEADINDADKYKLALKECDFVVHMAAESHVDRSIADGNSFIRSNISGTFTLLEAARSHPKVSFVHVSTDEVYGSRVQGESTEMDGLSPSSVYSASKASSDLLALANYVTHGQRVAVTRCTNNFGPFQHSEKFIPTVINCALLGKRIPIYGSGLNQREWINVSDHNTAVMAVIENFKPGEIWNIGSGHRLTNLDIARDVLEILGMGSELLTHVDDRKGHDFRYALNSSKIREQLGWEPDHLYKSSLKKTVDWYKAWFETNGEIY